MASSPWVCSWRLPMFANRSGSTGDAHRPDVDAGGFPADRRGARWLATSSTRISPESSGAAHSRPSKRAHRLRRRHVSPTEAPLCAQRRVSLEIAAGEVVGIVGAAAAAEHLAGLMQRLYPEQAAYSGRRRHQCSSTPPGCGRSASAQENFLFNRSVRENIIAPTRRFSLEAVMRAARMAGAHDFIAELPQGCHDTLRASRTNSSWRPAQRWPSRASSPGDPRIPIPDEAT